MSQCFDIGDETLWNPSNGASRLFRRQVELFEAELELSSGIGPMENDECQIDPITFETFVNALLAQHRRTSHAIVLALSASGLREKARGSDPRGDWGVRPCDGVGKTVWAVLTGGRPC
ncbi:DUF6086 family protein [Streptomyces scabichelini]|uniref:DUF6086 family protein n=1 Tax=Streptomyces scabichelini TaxID=2711217 RepID=UPI0030BA23A1